MGFKIKKLKSEDRTFEDRTFEDGTLNGKGNKRIIEEDEDAIEDGVEAFLL
jgi:hypothetical protein